MKKNLTRRSFLKTGFKTGLGALLAGYPFFIERYLFETNHYQVPVRNLPDVFTGYTLVHVTDIHYGFLMPLFVIKKIINRVNRIKKDMVVCTGDYVHLSNGASNIDKVMPEVLKLKAPKGVWSVLGNHDHRAGKNRCLHWLEKGNQNLRHRAVEIKKRGKSIWIGGAGDLWEDRPGIDRAFEKTPDAACKILLAHNPDTADTYFRKRVDLMISGHTHGGQVRIPFFGAPLLPVNNKAYEKGLVRTGKTPVFISKGLGWAILPVRFNCRPEIAVLHLIPDTASHKTKPT